MSAIPAPAAAPAGNDAPRPGHVHDPLGMGVSSSATAYTPKPRAGADTASMSLFVPLLLFFVAWLAWAIFQAVQLHEESKSLASLHANQDQQVQQSQRVRQTLDALALETKKLADAGNPNARTVIDELARRGITVTPQAQPAAAPAPR